MKEDAINNVTEFGKKVKDHEKKLYVHICNCKGRR